MYTGNGLGATSKIKKIGGKITTLVQKGKSLYDQISGKNVPAPAASSAPAYAASPASSLPKWAVPAALGGVALLFLLRRKKR